MSDTGRQSLTDKASAALKVRPRPPAPAPPLLSPPMTHTGRLTRATQPDSEKSTTEHFGDMFKGKADSAASTAQPQSEKTTTQRMGDTLSGNHNQDQVRRGRGAGRGVDADAVFGDAAVAHAEGEERDGPRRQLGQLGDTLRFFINTAFVSNSSLN